MTTKLDKNGICKGNGYFSITSKGFVKISEKDEEKEIYNIYNIPSHKLKMVNSFTKKFFNNNLNRYINYYKTL